MNIKPHTAPSAVKGIRVKFALYNDQSIKVHVHVHVNLCKNPELFLL